ncbi:MAG: protein translocase subunit SecF, partial [Planctomycetota bacterium]
LPTLVPAIARLLSPKVNWVGMRGLFLPVSLILIVGGASMVVYRGEDLLDIEFRSGTEVTFNVAAGADLSEQEVNDRLAALAGSDKAAAITAEIEAQVAEIQAENADREPDQQLEVPTLPDWTLLGEAQVVTVGDVGGSSGGASGGGGVSGGDGASGYRVATLIENAEALGDAIKVIFRDALDATESVDFAGLRLSVAEAKGLVEPIEGGSLYASLGRQFSEADPNVQPYVGGVAVVLEDLAPAISVEEVRERITRMRRQPDYEQLGLNELQVFGLDRAGTDRAGDATFDTIAVVLTDYETNYAEDRSDFTDSLGLAATGWALVRDALQRDTSLASVSNFSSQVSGTMKQQAIVAMALSLLAVVAYIWLRFGSLRYGLAAIAALVHDVCITLGILAICGYLSALPGFETLLLDDFKINLALVAALLTIVGYSLNDTIVVSDRIRENFRKLRKGDSLDVINASLNQTFGRTLVTSLTTLLVLIALLLFGGELIEGFAEAL